MTKFDKTKFTITTGDTVHYDGRYVANFKRKGLGVKDKFIEELIHNHTVEEFFGKMVVGKDPLSIVWGNEEG